MSCNNNCIYCFQEYDDIETEDYLVLKGEPTMRKDFLEKLDTDKPTVIHTNGRMFSSRDLCRKIGDQEVVTKFWHHDEEEFNRITGDISYRQTLKGILNLLNEGKKVSVELIITPDSKETIGSTLKLLDRIGVRKVYLSVSSIDLVDSSFSDPVSNHKGNLKIANGNIPICRLDSLTSSELVENRICFVFRDESWHPIIRRMHHNKCDCKLREFCDCNLEGPKHEFSNCDEAAGFLMRSSYKNVFKIYQLNSFFENKGIGCVIGNMDEAHILRGYRFILGDDCLNKDITVNLDSDNKQLSSQGKDCFFVDEQNNEELFDLMKRVGIGLSLKPVKLGNWESLHMLGRFIRIIDLDTTLEKVVKYSSNFACSRAVVLRNLSEFYMDPKVGNKLNRALANVKEDRKDTIEIKKFYKGTAKDHVELKDHVTIFNPDSDETVTKGRIIVAKDTNARILEHMFESKAVIVSKSSQSSHAVRVAKEIGLPCIYGVKGIHAILSENDMVSLDGGQVEVLKKGAVMDIIVAKGCGPKALRLSEVGSKYNVPRGFVVLSELMNDFFAHNSINLKGMTNEYDEQRFGQVQKAIMSGSIDTSAIDWIHAFLEPLGSEYIVRSCAKSEDLNKATYAGIYESIFPVGKENLLESIKKVWASEFSRRACLYKQRMKQPINFDMDVIVQEYIRGDYSGAYSSGKPGMLEIVKGTNHSLMQGETVGERVDPLSGESSIIPSDIYGKLVSMIKDLEEAYGQVSIEWTIKDGIIYVLQVRSVT